MSKQQFELNAAIEQLVATKKASGDLYTKQEIEWCRKYTGAGGMAKQGASGRGLLYEYYTPYEIVEKMIGLVVKHGIDVENCSVLEPSCGTGRFLEYFDPRCKVDAFEINPDNDTSFQIAKNSFSNFNIQNNYFESIFYDGNKRVGTPKRYDLVIGNPPYGKFSGLYAGKQREGKHTEALQYEHYFIEKGIELLKPKGLLCFIVPSSFMDNSSSYSSVKNKIASMAELVDAYRLPKSVFGKTDIQTDIILFQKN